MKPVDLRGKLPTHPTRHWARRTVADVVGVVFHQSAGPGDVEDVARYHVGPNHISPDGCPGVCYTFVVDRDGTVYQCNDLEDVTWSQGGHGVPLDGTRANTNYVSACFLGDFSGPGHDGRDKPTKAQLGAARELWDYLRKACPSVGDGALFGHSAFGKPACPGAVIQDLILELRGTDGGWLDLVPSTVRQWQAGLRRLGYDLGQWGPERDGVDGQWGSASRSALAKFQRDSALPLTGYRDSATASELARQLRAAMPAPVPPPPPPAEPTPGSA